MEQKGNHFDEKGNAIMVDVSKKEATLRIAKAEGHILMNETAYHVVESGTSKKGDVLGIARVAGIMAVKQTSSLIPLCHPLIIESTSIEFDLDLSKRCVRAVCTVQTTGKTGVEMEALCGVSVALLTIYDMCKALDRGMEICGVTLVEKQGGKSGHYRRKKEEQ